MYLVHNIEKIHQFGSTRVFKKIWYHSKWCKVF